MANIEHVELLSRGAFVWNAWRNKYPGVIPDFTDFNFARYKTKDEVLPGISGGDSWIEGHWDYNSVNFVNVDLSNALFNNSILSRKHIVKSNLSGADFSGCIFNDVLLKNSNFERAVFRNVNLKGATIVECSFMNTTITDCYIFGISSWKKEVTFEGSIQSDLIITKENEEVITVDNIESANLIYNLYNNKTAASTINSLSKKLVFILGNFSPERKTVLDRLKGKLRSHNLIPIVFDFDRPQNRTLTETVLLIAGLASFVIADLTDGRSVQQELEIISHRLTSVVIQPILLKQQKVYGMLEEICMLRQVLPLFEYDSIEHLLQSLEPVILAAVASGIRQLKRKI